MKECLTVTDQTQGPGHVRRVETIAELGSKRVQDVLEAHLVLIVAVIATSGAISMKTGPGTAVTLPLVSNTDMIVTITDRNLKMS